MQLAAFANSLSSIATVVRMLKPYRAGVEPALHFNDSGQSN